MTETGQQTIQDFTPRQRKVSALLTLLLLAIMTAFSALLARTALMSTGSPLWLRGPFFAVSGLLAWAVVQWLFLLIRRKLKTGSFLLTRAESLAKQAEIRGKMGAGKPFGPQAKYWIFPLVLMGVLIAFGIGALVASTCACSDGSSLPLRLRILLWALAATFMLLPGWFAFKSIQRKLKSGSFLPSQQELAKARAKCGAPKPLRQRLLIAGLYWLVAILWTFSVFHRHHSQSEIFPPWLLAGLWWFAAAIWTWQLFRPRAGQCALPQLPGEQPMPPEAPSH